MQHKVDYVIARGPAQYAQICSKLRDSVVPEVETFWWWKRDDLKYLSIGPACSCLVGWWWLVSVGRSREADLDKERTHGARLKLG